MPADHSSSSSFRQSRWFPLLLSLGLGGAVSLMLYVPVLNVLAFALLLPFLIFSPLGVGGDPGSIMPEGAWVPAAIVAYYCVFFLVLVGVPIYAYRALKARTPDSAADEGSYTPWKSANEPSDND